jgi:LDH2 family malate/lactate/ureidoglycolate dehydrogenase
VKTATTTHDATIRMAADDLRRLMERLLAAVGCDAESARTTSDALLEADLRGYGSHGLLRLPTMLRRIQSGMISAVARPRIVAERSGTALVDAERALGPVGAAFGAALAVRKAEAAGVAAVGVIHGDHICLTGFYADRMARAGCVGLVTTVTQPLVHPLGGSQRLLGTNPLAIAIPGDGEDPLLLDFATSAIAFGTVLTAQARGESLPPGVAVGPGGEPTTDPAEAARGALAPFAGHKGFGLNLFLGLLAGPLLGAKVGGPLGQAVREGRYDKGDLFVAIHPAAFGDPAVFRAAVAAHLAEVKASRRGPGVAEIRLPGERAWAERARRLAGGVPIEPAVWAEVAGLARELGVSLPSVG